VSIQLVITTKFLIKMSNTNEILVTAIGGAESTDTSVVSVPTMLVHSSVKFQESDNETYISKSNDNKLSRQKTNYAIGTVVTFKQGSSGEMYNVDTTSKEECDSLSEAYYKSRLLRLFGYTKFKGMKVTKVDFQVNGLEKRFVPPAVEENDSEALYMAKNKETVVRLVGELSNYLQKSQVNVDALLNFMQK
jgi:hypothetical protein